MKRILITGSGGPAGINVTKSLLIAPEKMYLIGTDSNKYHKHLSLTRKTYVTASATKSNYLDELNRILDKENIEFIHPQPDIEVKKLGHNRKKIHAKTLLPSNNAIDICQNKYRSFLCWSKAGIPAAKTIILETEDDINKSLKELGSPVWIRATFGAGGRGSTLAYTLRTIKSWISYWNSRNVDWQFLAQEYLPGRNIGWHSLWKDGELITSMARERIEYIYPNLSPSGITGTPVVQRTIHDDDANQVATKAVLSIDKKYTGIACVDLKEKKDGTPCATEINPGRFFTTSYFFSLAGLNLPYIYVKLAYHEDIEDLPKYNGLPASLCWIRHIDAPARLVKNDTVIGKMYDCGSEEEKLHILNWSDKVKLVIFDLDGTLADIPCEWSRMDKEIERKFDVNLHPYAEVIPTLPRKTRKEIFKIQDKHELESLPSIVLKKKTLKRLRSCQRKGILTALVTLQGRKFVKNFISQFNLYFDRIVTREDCLSREEQLGIVLSEMKVSPENSIFIGNTEQDRESAMKIRCTFLDVASL